MSSNVDMLRERLWNAFADAPKPAKIDACWAGCCLTFEEAERLLAQDRRTADRELVRSIASDCLVTIGDEVTFRHYLPRVLSECFEEPYFVVFPEFGGRLIQAGLDLWCAERQLTIYDCLMHLNRSLLTSDEPDDHYLILAAYAGFPIGPFLRTLDDQKHLNARLEILKMYADCVEAGTMIGPYWESDHDTSMVMPDQAKNDMLRWLRAHANDRRSLH